MIRPSVRRRRSRMAAPVIDSIVVTYPAGQNYVSPGQTAQIVVTAHDPDTQNLTVNVEVVDAAGNKGTGTTTVKIQDAYDTTATAASGTITETATNGVFNFTP